jgi:hypothetical protein
MKRKSTSEIAMKIETIKSLFEKTSLNNPLVPLLPFKNLS